MLQYAKLDATGGGGLGLRRDTITLYPGVLVASSFRITTGESVVRVALSEKNMWRRAMTALELSLNRTSPHSIKLSSHLAFVDASHEADISFHLLRRDVIFRTDCFHMQCANIYHHYILRKAYTAWYERART